MSRPQVLDSIAPCFPVKKLWGYVWGGIEMYQLYRKKVIDKEIKFDPTVDEAIAWGLDENMPHYGQVKDHLRLLDLRNVRSCPG